MVKMTPLRWLALVFFVAAFAATFTSAYQDHQNLWLGVWAMGMVCLVLSWRREP